LRRQNEEINVVCPINRVVGSYACRYICYWRDNTISIYAWFGASATPAAQVTCIVREMATGTTDTAAANAISQVIAQSGGGVPEVVSQAFDATSFGPGTLTATCKLPPGTGINAVTFSNAVHSDVF
jgi:hypothetical protein